MNTRPCPECGTDIAYNARSCGCGWGGRSTRTRPADDHANAQFVAERKQMLATIEAVATEKARQWLEDRRIVSVAVTGSQRREVLRAYLARLKTLPKPEPRSWAYAMLSRIAEGEVLPQICEQYAQEVVSMGRDLEDLQEAA